MPKSKSLYLLSCLPDVLVQFQCSFHSLGVSFTLRVPTTSISQHKNLLSRRRINCAFCWSGYLCTDFSFATTKPLSLSMLTSIVGVNEWPAEYTLDPVFQPNLHSRYFHLWPSSRCTQIIIFLFFDHSVIMERSSSVIHDGSRYIDKTTVPLYRS